MGFRWSRVQIPPARPKQLPCSQQLCRIHPAPRMQEVVAYGVLLRRCWNVGADASDSSAPARMNLEGGMREVRFSAGSRATWSRPAPFDGGYAASVDSSYSF